MCIGNNVPDESNPAAQQDMERRKFETEEDKEQKLPGIRDYSRQAYLKKREEQKLDELKDAIEDEKALFAVSSLVKPGWEAQNLS